MGILTVAFLAVSLLFATCDLAGPDKGLPDNGPNEDATLRSLSVDKGTLSPAFSASNFEYSVTVKNAYNSITVTATANSGKATVDGAGQKSLEEGSNSIPVVVKAESGGSKTYTITVTRLDSSFTGGIETAEDLAKIGVANTHPLSGDYLLMNDITLTEWKPVGNAVTPFSGSFDGNGYKITLASFSSTAISDNTADTDYIGIFGYVKGASASAKAEIKNLTINSTVNQSMTRPRNTSVGLLASRAETAVVIENITLTGTFSLSSSHRLYLGGVVGITNGADVIVKNCNSFLKVNIIPGGGGVGTGASALAPATGDTYVGGIVGYFNNGSGIENCHVIGDITADNVASTSTGNGQVYVGGITGGSEYNFSTTYKGYIKDSSFIGTLIGRAKGSWTFAGGIAGTIVGGNVNDNTVTTRIERCFAKGIVSVAGTNSGNPYVGGIVGYNYYGALVSQSYFDGEVIAGKSGDYTGGIAGYNSQTTGVANSRIEDCWSNGKVTGFNNAGGIVGQNQVNTYLRRSYSRSVIIATNGSGSGVGGITGLHASTMTDAVTACVALNPSITAKAGNNVHRVTGSGTGNKSNNYAWSGMAVTTGGTYTPEKGANATDGADCAEKPTQAFYEGIGWNFSTVWIMGSDGYPKLRWQ